MWFGEKLSNNTCKSFFHHSATPSILKLQTLIVLLFSPESYQIIINSTQNHSKPPETTKNWRKEKLESPQNNDGKRCPQPLWRRNTYLLKSHLSLIFALNRPNPVTWEAHEIWKLVSNNQLTECTQCVKNWKYLECYVSREKHGDQICFSHKDEWPNLHFFFFWKIYSSKTMRWLLKEWIFC